MTSLPSMRETFLALAAPDELGHSRWVSIEELIAKDQRFALGNGGSWCRDDGPLKAYRIERDKTKPNGKQGRGITRIRLTGLKEDAKERAIRPDIKKAIRSRRCVVLDVGSQIECDHKNGRYDSNRMLDPDKQKESDFQPLSKAVNVAKRTHCNICEKTGNRYDARRLGYLIGWLGEGTSSYLRWGCTGCYWHDPGLFNWVASGSKPLPGDNKSVAEGNLHNLPNQAK